MVLRDGRCTEVIITYCVFWITDVYKSNQNIAFYLFLLTSHLYHYFSKSKIFSFATCFSTAFQNSRLDVKKKS